MTSGFGQHEVGASGRSAVPGLVDAATMVAKDTPIVITYHAASLVNGQWMFNAFAATYALAESYMMNRARLTLGVSIVDGLASSRTGDCWPPSIRPDTCVTAVARLHTGRVDPVMSGHPTLASRPARTDHIDQLLINLMGHV
jgi:hypothetical protein